MAFAINPLTYPYNFFTDNCGGTPDYWTNGNSATHTFSTGIMTVTDSNSGLSGFINTAAFTPNTGDMLVQIKFNVTSRSVTSGQFAGVIQLIDNPGSFLSSVVFGIGGNGKFSYLNAGAAVTDLTTTYTTATDYYIDIVVHLSLKTWDVYINGVLDTAGLAFITGTTSANVPVLVIGGGNSPSTWVYAVDYVTYRQKNDGTFQRSTAQDITSTGTTSVSGTFPSPTVPGDLLIAFIGDNSGGSGDTISGWTNATGDIAVNPSTGGGIYYKVADGTETIVTASNGSASGMTMFLCEYTGFVGTPTLDKHVVGGTGLGASSTTTGTTAATTAANEIALVIGQYNSSVTFVSWSNSFATLTAVTAGSKTAIPGQKFLSATGTQTSTITVSASTSVIAAAIATFKGVIAVTNGNFLAFM